MIPHCIVTLGGQTEWLLLQSSGTELFKVVKLYLVDGVEMAGSQPLYWENIYTVTVVILLS